MFEQDFNMFYWSLIEFKGRQTFDKTSLNIYFVYLFGKRCFAHFDSCRQG